MFASGDLLVCTACGTQYDTSDSSSMKSCRICDDPRQYVPPTGQAFTSLHRMQGSYHNVWAQDKEDPRIWAIWTEPRFAIGERALLLQTPNGNILWDLFAFLDASTVDMIKALGGLKAIVISHPHYYTTHLEWARIFGCPVYLSSEDQSWLNRPLTSTGAEGVERRFITTDTEEIVPGVTAIKLGGHFPGSLVLHWDNKLFVADTLVTIPSALYHVNRLPGTTSFTFFWSIPNMIPLPPWEIARMWKMLRPWRYSSTHGAFLGQDVYGRPEDQNDMRWRVLESMKIQVRAQGWLEHPLLAEVLDDHERE